MEQVYDQADPLAPTRWLARTVVAFRLLGEVDGALGASDGPLPWGDVRVHLRSPAQRIDVSYRVLWNWSPRALWLGAAVFGWLFLVWAYVAQVGIWTQIRQGLPDFAHPPRTIVAAANLQSCKIVLLAAGILLGCGVEVASRWSCNGQASPGYRLAVCAVGGALVLAAGTAWAGALRSDFTRQLIRSPIHAGRIILMYAVVLPALTVFAVALALRMGMLF